MLHFFNKEENNKRLIEIEYNGKFAFVLDKTQRCVASATGPTSTSN